MSQSPRTWFLRALFAANIALTLGTGPSTIHSLLP